MEYLFFFAENSSLPSGHMTGLQLRNLIIDGLNDNTLEWPMNFKPLNKSQWIKYMEQGPNWYLKQTNIAYERLLLNLASKLLKRKICLISLFPEDKDETFEPPMPTSSRPYYLLGCNKAYFNNFYISIFKDESNDHETIATQESSLRLSVKELMRRFEKR